MAQCRPTSGWECAQIPQSPSKNAINNLQSATGNWTAIWILFIQYRKSLEEIVIRYMNVVILDSSGKKSQFHDFIDPDLLNSFGFDSRNCVGVSNTSNIVIKDAMIWNHCVNFTASKFATGMSTLNGLFGSGVPARCTYVIPRGWGLDGQVCDKRSELQGGYWIQAEVSGSVRG